jgi:hypothetical protein
VADLQFFDECHCVRADLSRRGGPELGYDRPPDGSRCVGMTEFDAWISSETRSAGDSIGDRQALKLSRIALGP